MNWQPSPCRWSGVPCGRFVLLCRMIRPLVTCFCAIMVHQRHLQRRWQFHVSIGFASCFQRQRLPAASRFHPRVVASGTGAQSRVQKVLASRPATTYLIDSVLRDSEPPGATRLAGLLDSPLGWGVPWCLSRVIRLPSWSFASHGGGTVNCPRLSLSAGLFPRASALHFALRGPPGLLCAHRRLFGACNLAVASGSATPFLRSHLRWIPCTSLRLRLLPPGD